MFSTYLASAEEGEGEATQPTDSFVTSDILESAKKYERKMGKTQTSMSAVRLGAGRTALAPRRMTPAKEWAAGRAGSSSEECRKRLQTIEDEERLVGRGEREVRLERLVEKGDKRLEQEERREEKVEAWREERVARREERRDRMEEGMDRSVSSLLESLRMSPRTSPDSGSFSMGTGDLATSKDLGSDFTDALRPHTMGAVRAVARARPTAPPPVRMVAREGKENLAPQQQPVRVAEKARVIAAPVRMVPPAPRAQELPRRVEWRGEEVQEELGRVREERVGPRPLGLQERLQKLSGEVPHSAPQPSFQPQRTPLAAPRPREVATTPLPPQALPHTENAPAPSAARALLQTPVPRPAVRHAPAPTPLAQSATPRPSSNPAPTPHQPTMPPPSMSIGQVKEQVLVVRGKRYRVMKLLGKGGSSRVYEAFDEQRSAVVAIKRVNLEEADEATTAGYINEINLLERLQGEDRIVRLFDHETVEEEAVLYVVMEKGDTDLASLLKKYASKEEMTPAMIKHYWTEMLHAVAAIHRSKVIHKDLKPANFLLVAGRLKLIDFGIASSVQSDKTSVMIDNQMGTFNFMSPESIQDMSGTYGGAGHRPCIKISYKSDVWSLGCILYNLTYGRMPFGDIKHPIMKLQAITDSNHAIPFPPLAKEDAVLTSLIQSCLVRDPAGRPSIQELLNHRYVTGRAEEEAVAAAAVQGKMDPLEQLKMLGMMGVLSPSTLAKAKSKAKSLSELA